MKRTTGAVATALSMAWRVWSERRRARRGRLRGVRRVVWRVVRVAVRRSWEGVSLLVILRLEEGVCGLLW